MEFIKPDINIDFVGKIKIALLLSLSLILISILSLIIKGPKYGVDFAGGILVQVRFSKAVEISRLRNSLKDLKLGDFVVQKFGEKGTQEYIIKLEKKGENPFVDLRIKEGLQKRLGGLELRRTEMVGPKIGKELRKKGILAVFFALAGILVYLWLRFEFRFGLGAILALGHDIIIAIGALCLTNKPFDLTIVAALLTLAGYSVNDTIIVCDRIRENMKKMQREKLEKVINKSINETLSRTILTSGTVILVLIALFFFGGLVIHDFAFALLVGVVAGVYSTIYIASPILILWEEFFQKRRRLTR